MSFHDEHFQPEEVDEQIEELLHTVFPQSKAAEASTRLVRELQALSMDDKARLQKIRARLAEHADNVGAITTPIEIQDYQDTHQVSTNFYPEQPPKLRKGKGKLISTLAGLVAVLLIASTVVFFAQGRLFINGTQTGALPLQPTPNAMSSPHISASGVIFPRMQAGISFPVDGRVINVLVKPGDQVKLKQPLIQLDPAPLNIQVQQLQANLVAAQQSYDIALANGKAAEIAAAQQQLTQARNQLVMLQAQLNSDFVQNGKLLAPQAGVVTLVDIRPGETFKANIPLIVIADESALVVHARLSYVYSGDVLLGQTATVTAGNLPGKNFSGNVVNITPVLQGNFEVWVMFTHPKGTPPWHLTPGQIASISIPIHD